MSETLYQQGYREGYEAGLEQGLLNGAAMRLWVLRKDGAEAVVRSFSPNEARMIAAKRDIRKGKVEFWSTADCRELTVGGHETAIMLK